METSSGKLENVDLTDRTGRLLFLKINNNSKLFEAFFPVIHSEFRRANSYPEILIKPILANSEFEPSVFSLNVPVYVLLW
jgi:hypothetical protein